MTSGLRARTAVEFALTHEREADVIAGVKAAVIDELKSLDPLAQVDSTDYFNHSFVPDLVVKWHDRGKLTERNVYLRFTLRAASLGGDVSALAETGPIVLTLKANEDSSTREYVQQEVSGTARVLVTDISALDEATAVEPSSTGSPLLSLARSNLVRGARGLLETATVDELVAASSPSDDGVLQATNLDRFSNLVRSYFVSDAATRLRRASDLIQLGVRPDVEELFQEDESLNLIYGSLSDVELRVLLPYLLSRPEITRSRQYWRYVGSLMDLKGLEELSAELEGLDLTPLVAASMSTWFASRASLVMQADDVTDPLAADHQVEGRWSVEGAAAVSRVQASASEATTEEEPSPGWRIQSGMLSLNLEGWRLFIASTGTKLRGRSDSLSARWADLRPALEGFELVRVTLLGVVRRVEVAAERDADVRADVATISDSLDDSFFVPSAAVWESGEEGRVAVDVDFTKMLAFSASRERVTVGGLARIAIRLLGYRNPVDNDELARYLETR
ncbi:MAG TPA: hypothetical protein VHX38_31750 [Pseudonocardiaceae bacterium]|nr:hypothetical protein [Pseudonocardiaceae bacterium]